MNISVFYEPSGEFDYLLPVWMMLDKVNWDWSKSIYINIESPFERFTYDEIDNDIMAISVPDHVYVRNSKDPFLLGLHLPSLKDYMFRNAITFPIEINDVQRLMLRISDIEETMQCEIRSSLHW